MSILIHDYPATGTKTLVELFIGNPVDDIECHVLLAKEIEHWINFAAEVFPRTVPGLLSGAEIKFQEMKREQKAVFIEE